MRTKLLLAITTLLLVSWNLSASAQTANLEGRVFDQANGRGLENLEVKMTPPSNTNLPVRLANTDGNGAFRFPDIRISRYLVEVSQGPNLLSRVQIDAATQTHLEIPLQRR